MRKLLIFKSGIMAIAAVAVMVSSTKTVHCMEGHGLDDIEQFIEESNKDWEGAGYSTQPSPPDTAQQSGAYKKCIND